VTPGQPPAEAQDGRPRRVTRCHALSHADLRRVLPRLFAPAAIVPTASGLEAIYDESRRVRVSFDAETESRLGALRVLSTRFTFEFEGWDDSQVEQFLLRCEKGLQQGGG
jgi:hypothetical protein